MAEYIDREKLIDAIKNDCSEMVYYTKSEAIDCINAEPAADVAPVVHGGWKVIHKKYQFTGGGNPVYACSECEWVYGATLVPRYNYCPNCGAKMGGDVND